jgi:hypothetical protein
VTRLGLLSSTERSCNTEGVGRRAETARVRGCSETRETYDTWIRGGAAQHRPATSELVEDFSRMSTKYVEGERWPGHI